MVFQEEDSSPWWKALGGALLLRAGGNGFGLMSVLPPRVRAAFLVLVDSGGLIQGQIPWSSCSNHSMLLRPLEQRSLNGCRLERAMAGQLLSISLVTCLLLCQGWALPYGFPFCSPSQRRSPEPPRYRRGTEWLMVKILKESEMLYRYILYPQAQT